MTLISGNNSPFRKLLKYSALTFGSLLVFIIIIIGIVVNFIVTPAKLTPLILKESSRFVDATVECESVDLTFFSTFPQVGLRLKKGAIITNKRDSIAGESAEVAASDTLISFDNTLLTINPLSYILKNRIHISTLLFEDATIYAYVNESGKPNWDIFNSAAEDEPEVSMPQDSLPPSEMPEVEIGGVEIKNANITFDDRNARLFTDLRGVNFKLKGALSAKESELDIHLDSKNIMVWQKGKLLLNKLGFSADSRLLADREHHLYTLDNTVFDLNGIKVGAQGEIQGDTLSERLRMNVHFGLQVPSLETVLKLIPTSIVKETADVKADGSVNLRGSLQGYYSNDQTPVLSFESGIEKGRFHYKGMPYGVDQLDMSVEGRIDLMNDDSTYIKVNSFDFKGASSEMSAMIDVRKPLSDPLITLLVKTNINFTELAKTFPLQEEVKMGGILKTELNSKVTLSSIKNQDWGKLNLNGFLEATQLFLVIPNDSLNLNIDKAGATFGANVKDADSFQGTNLLNGVVGFEGLSLEYRSLRGNMGKTALHLKTSPLKDTTAIATIQGTLGYSALQIEIGDSVQLRSGAAKTTLRLQPSKLDPKVPEISSLLKFDSLFVKSGEHTAALFQAGFDLKSVRDKEMKRHWISTGTVGFASFEMFTPLFPLAVKMPHSKLTLVKDGLLLNQAAIKIGDSDMIITGELSNLKETFFNGGTLLGKMEVNSRFIDCNQLMDALSAQQTNETKQNAQNATPKAEGVDQKGTETSKKAGESTTVRVSDSTAVFIVPDKIDFVLSTDIKRVKFGSMDIENILGEMTIRNQSVELSELKLHTMAADMVTTMVYKATDAKSAYTGFDLNMKDIQVGKLVEFIPALDTLVPMLRSLDGLVNFRIAAESQLGADLMPVISSIQAAAKVRGDSLVLMDGETFSEISKMLRFKNKKRNVIDSVSVDLMVRNGQIEIYPFLVGMDRYLAAVGGKHNIDMTFDYHISLLDSPIPFKIGVDVKGNMEDFDFKITKPKFKDLRKSARTSPVDSTGLSVRERIKRTLQERSSPGDL